MNEKAKGYILAVIAAATYGMNPLFALPLYADGMNPDSVLFFRYLFAIPLVGAMIKGRGRDFKIHRTDILPLVVLGVLMAASSLTLFEAYNYMDAGIASTILFIYPILVALIMAAVYKEKVTMQTALCILLALSGIAMLYQGGDGATLSLTGTLLVFASAPPVAERNGHTESHVLRTSVWCIALRSTVMDEPRPHLAYPLVALG